MSATAAVATVAIALASLNGGQARNYFDPAPANPSYHAAPGRNLEYSFPGLITPSEYMESWNYRPQCLKLDAHTIDLGYAMLDEHYKRTLCQPHEKTTALLENILYALLDKQLEFSSKYPPKLTIINKDADWTLSNSVIVGSCRAECAVENTGMLPRDTDPHPRKLFLWCHDKKIAPKCAVRINSLSKCSNPQAKITSIKRFRNSNKIKPWRAKPKF